MRRNKLAGTYFCGNEASDYAKEQGYLDKLMSFPSQNLKTREQFKQLRGMMQDYINRSCHCS